MKKFFALSLIILLFGSLFGQFSDSFNYQAIIRGSNGQVLPNKQLYLRVGILQGSMSGNELHSEVFATTSSEMGLVNVEIGSVNKQSFQSINWSNAPYYLKIDIDLNDGRGFLTMGTSKLLSVPFALFAKNAQNVVENDPVFSNHSAKSITSSNINAWNSAYSWGNHSNEGYLKSFSESDPIFSAHPAKTITSQNLSSWTEAFTWGNHANAGYLKSFIESDPVFAAHPSKSISGPNIANWNLAYSWGNHQGLYRPVSYVPSWTEITNKPTFSTVATSGSYTDLTNKPVGANVGDMQYWNGTQWVSIPVGQPGQYLQLNASGIPAWGGAAYASISTTSVSSITQTTAVSGGNVTNDGGSTITAKGVCWSTSANPTIANSKTTDGSGTGSFTSNITGLNAGATYYVRAYATNSIGTVYGNSVSFTTQVQLATVTTGSTSSITTNSATIGGNVTSSGSSSVTERGICWSTTANPTVSNSKVSSGSGTGSFSCNLTGLAANTTYHVRAYATNSGGTAYGADVTFTTQAITVADNSHLLLGNPSNATTDIANENNYLMEKAQFVLSYNNSKLIPNWTSWHLYSGDIGSTARQDNFRADTDLPSSWYRVGSSDFQYATYGFDRGHMCPSADRTLTVADNSATFLMTNMIPQAPNNNQQTWQNLETYSRALVDAGNELYIISGPHGQGGSSAKGTFNSISVNSGANSITVPNKTWKIIVVLPNGDNDLSRITTSTRVIAVVMPNDQTCNSKPWYDYRVSVDSLETLTGYDFLSNISTTIQNFIEANVDSVTI